MTQPTPEPTPEPTPTHAPAPVAFTPPASQADLDRIITDRLNRQAARFSDYDTLKARATQLDAIEEQNKTELQKAQDALTAAEQRAQTAEQQATKADVALVKGVPANLLSGTTRADLEASADALLAFRGSNTSTPPPPSTAAVTALAPGNSVKAEKSVSAGAELYASRRKPTTTP